MESLKKIGKIVKTSIILFLMTVGLWTKLLAQDKYKTELRDELLNGQVKVLKEKSFKFHKNKQDTVLDYELVFKFSEVGLLKERKGLGQLSTYKYNSENQIVQVNVCSGDGKSCTVNEYSYENGNLKIHFSKQPVSSEITTVFNEHFITYYSYNVQNKLIEEKKLRKPVKGKEEKFVEHKKYEYDSIGNRVIEEALTESSTVFKRVENRYSDTILTESFMWMKFEGEDLYTKDVYEYFENGKIKSKTQIIYDYNSTDRIAQKVSTTYSYEVDKDGRLIKKAESSTKTKITEFYNFDSKNNWQRMVVNENGEIKIILRDYEYYD